MSTLVSSAADRTSLIVTEARKLPAFVRRDFLTAWSYRLSFFSEWVGLITGAVSFYFIGLMVDPTTLPTYGGSRASYMEFVEAGVALGVFVTFGLGRVGKALRNEQLMGTLESLLMTPTSSATIQLGSVFYDLLYIPIQTGLFFVMLALTFGLDFEASGIGPAAATLLLFIPFVWGLGMASAGTTLTFKQGAGAFGLGVTALTLFSGAYFPLDLLPSWVETVAVANPMTLALEALREALLGGAGWGDVWLNLLLLVPYSAGSLLVGMFIFRRAMLRERRRGTIGLY